MKEIEINGYTTIVIRTSSHSEATNLQKTLFEHGIEFPAGKVVFFARIFIIRYINQRKKQNLFVSHENFGPNYGLSRGTFIEISYNDIMSYLKNGDFFGEEISI